jgi:hypothetical protein
MLQAYELAARVVETVAPLIRDRRRIPQRRISPETIQALGRQYADALIAGDTLDVVGARAGVSRERIRQIVLEAGLADEVKAFRDAQRAAHWDARRQAIEQRRAQRRMEVRPNTKARIRYTDDEIIERLRAWIAGGGSGLLPDWVASGERPSSATIVNRFGWSEAVRQAGGTSRGNVKTRKDYRTQQECLDAVVAFLSDPNEKYSGPINYTAWAQPRGLPGDQTVRHRFPSWVAAKQAAIDVINARTSGDPP